MRARLVVVFGVIALMLSACAPTVEKPFPLPKTTGTIATKTTPATPASDVDKAIAVYRDYVAAGNRVVVSDETTWEPYLSLTSGEFQRVSRTELVQFAADGTRLMGDAHVVSSTTTSSTDDLIVLHVCLDVSQTTITDANGATLVSPSRAPVSGFDVHLSPLRSSGEWRIIDVKQAGSGPAC